MLYRHTGKVGCIDPTGCQKVFHCFVSAAELGSTRIGGNGLSSGIARVNGQDDRERENDEKRESPVFTNYSVKNLKFPTETGVPTIQWPF